MSYFDFPHARNYDSDLSFLIDEYQRLLTKVEDFEARVAKLESEVNKQ